MSRRLMVEEWGLESRRRACAHVVKRVKVTALGGKSTLRRAPKQPINKLEPPPKLKTPTKQGKLELRSLVACLT